MSSEPKILGFICQNSAGLCVDFAGMELKNYTPSFLPLKLPCLGNLDILYLLKAYFSGADGVLVLGCSPGHCRHKMGNERARRRAEIVRSLLEIFGVGRDRLNFVSIHPSEISKMVETVNGFNERISQLGPSPFLKPDGDEGRFFWMTEFEKCDACHQCREVCPACFCKRCYPESFPNFGIDWIAHVIERCTNCGACQDACPQGIHLFEMVQLLQQKISDLNRLPLNILLPKGSERGGIINIPK